MRIDRIALRGIGPFRGDVEVSLADVPGRLIAVVGQNGEGKTAFVESLFLGSLDRTTTNRGGLIDVASGRDSALEAAWATDRGAYVIKHLVDGVSRKGESLVTNGTEKPVLPDTKVSTFDEWRKEHFPPSDVISATLLGVQGDNGYLSWPQARRREVVSKALQIDGLEALAEQARERAREARAKRDSLSGLIAREREQAPTVEVAEYNLQCARGTANARDEDLRIAREALADAKARHATLVAAWENAENARSLRREALGKLQNCENLLTDIRRRRDAAEATVADAERVREAAQRVDKLLGERGVRDLDLREAEARLAESERELADMDRERQEALDAYAAAKRRVDAGEEARRDLKDARYVAAGIEEKRVEARRLDEAVTRLREETLNHKDLRINDLRYGLTRVTHNPSEARTIAQGVLDEDDEQAKRDIAAEVRQQERDAAEASRELRMMETAAARIPDLEKAVQAAAEAEREMNTARARQEHADNGRRDVVLRRDVRKGSVDGLREALTKIDMEIADLTPAAKRLQDVTAAEARLEEILRAEATAEASLRDAESDLADCPEPPDAEPIPDVSAQERAVAGAEKAARDAHAAVAVAEKGLEDARAAAERIAEQERDLAALDRDLSDWTRLGADLGRTGLQAMLLDAAAPELTEITNDILHRAFGTRYTVEFTTTRPSADGKKTLEVYDVTVIDTEKGYAGPATGLSGGQRVIVGTAIRFALATVAGRQSGFTPGTMVIDEGGAALDQHGAAEAWVRMVGVAAEALGVDKVLIVSHDETVIERCDARIEIEDGRVSVAA